ncbi:hypothetical protein Clacol_010087 [Clathrus columnatus]|uniref:Uncharacterized protein n=1 Tax=Clathrus columnatus TaxID=1419009 RepID=A0AAV5AMI3_9AGAM|nr:hypothetical protein Clacol_010087 [Clathrus columnatus]
MPKNSNGTTSKSTSSSRSSNSDYAIYKSYGGWQNFHHCHRLKPWDDDDLEEGKAIIQALRDADTDYYASAARGGGNQSSSNRLTVRQIEKG